MNRCRRARWAVQRNAHSRPRLLSTSSPSSPPPPRSPPPLDHRQRVMAPAASFFEAVPSLVRKREAAASQGKPLFVMLEGASGCGKAELLWRMAHLGYATVHVPWLTHAHRVLGTEWQRCDITGQLWTETFTTSWLRHVGTQMRHAEQAAAQAAPRHGIVFVSRSGVGPFLQLWARRQDPGPRRVPHDPDALLQRLKHQCLSWMQTTAKEHHVAAVLCHSDGQKLKERLAGRLFNDRESDLVPLRKALGEDDVEWMERVADAVQRVAEEDEAVASCFAAHLPTTSVKQASANLLTMLDITPSFFGQGLGSLTPNK